MGSFNVPCVVTKTPIHYEDECVVIVFNNEKKGFRGWAEEGQGSEFLIQNHLIGVYHGKYDDYGQIDNKECPDLQGGELINRKVIGYFVSKEAWDFIDQKYQSNPYWVQQNVELLNMVKISEENGKESNIKKVFGDKLDKFKKFQNEYRIVDGLIRFCENNNFYPFTFSFSDFYSSQDWHLKESKELQKLREIRINKQEEQEQRESHE